jgi:membrane protease YdiL (CAAX protease family)
MSERVPPRPDRPPSGIGPVPSRPPSTWRWWEAIGVYVLAILASSFVTLPLLETVRPPGLANLVTSAVIALLNIGILLFWLSRFHPEWRGAVGFPSRIWPEVRAGAAFGLVLYPAIVLGAGTAISVLLREISGHEIRAPRQLPAHLSAIGVAVSIVYAVVVAPLHEELFFRGILFRSIRDRYGFGVGAVGSGLAFGLIHYVPSPALDSVLLMSVMMVTGIALAYLYDRRGNVVADMVAHATFNVIGLILIFAVR